MTRSGRHQVPIIASDRVELHAPQGIPEIGSGDDLAMIIVGALSATGDTLREADVVVLAQKVVSKAEGRHVDLADVAPGPRARKLAAVCQKDPRLVELILSESREVLRCVPGVIVVQTHHGLVLANAGIDRSNVKQAGAGERLLLLPKDPDASAAALRRRFLDLAGVQVGVVINDSLGRAWRNGTMGAAIGVNGLTALQDMRGEADRFGFRLRVTEVAVADEIAAAASLMMGQSAEGRPVVVVRGLTAIQSEGRAADLVRPKEKDLFR